MKLAFIGFILTLATLIYLTFGQIILTVGQAVIQPIQQLGF